MQPDTTKATPKESGCSRALARLLTIVALLAIFIGLMRFTPPGPHRQKETRTIANMDSIAKSLQEYAALKDNVTGTLLLTGIFETRRSISPPTH